MQWKDAEEPTTISATERQRRWMEQHNLTMLMAQGSLAPGVLQAVREQLRGNGGREETAIHMFQTDHRGTPYRMIDAQTHVVVWQRETDPWGNTLKELVNENLREECHPNIEFQGQPRTSKQPA